MLIGTRRRSCRRLNGVRSEAAGRDPGHVEVISRVTGEAITLDVSEPPGIRRQLLGTLVCRFQACPAMSSARQVARSA
jgi:hypothetical protein